MKKIISVLVIAMMMMAMLSGCSSNTATPAPADQAAAPSEEATTPAESADETAALPAADVAEQGYDFYDGAMTYADAIAKLGPIPKPDKPLQLGYVCKAFENEFWRMQKEGAEDIIADLQNQGYDIKIDVRAAQGETDEQGQLAVFNDMINKDYDGILVSAISPGNLVPGAEEANKKGIEMVISMDAFMPQVESTVGAWHYQAGQLAAQYINDAIGGEGQVAIIQGLPKAAPAITRTEGFKKWFEENNPNVEVVAIQNADWDRMKAKDVTDIWLKQYPELKGIYANNDTMAMGALEAARAADKIGQLIIVGTDGTSEAKTSIANGELTATIDSFPYYMAQISTEMLIRKLEGQDVPKVIYSPQVVVDKENVNADPLEIMNSVGWNGMQFEN